MGWSEPTNGRHGWCPREVKTGNLWGWWDWQCWMSDTYRLLPSALTIPFPKRPARKTWKQGNFLATIWCYKESRLTFELAINLGVGQAIMMYSRVKLGEHCLENPICLPHEYKWDPPFRFFTLTCIPRNSKEIWMRYSIVTWENRFTRLTWWGCWSFSRSIIPAF